MNSSPASVVGILDRLSIGVSRVSIRHGSTRPRHRKAKPELTGFRPGHGEKIWVHNHIVTGMVIYSHDAKLQRDSHKALSQIPFTTKKQKPPRLREDYWTPMCLVEFPKGQGLAGRSVMQKLREFRARHELEWGWQAEEFKGKSKREIGAMIHNQKPNAVADIAAVLAGAGRGNRIWTTEPEPVSAEEAKEWEESQNEADTTAASGDAGIEKEAKAETPTLEAARSVPESETKTSTSGTARPEGGAKSATAIETEPKRGEPGRRLIKTNIYWSNDADLRWAREWSDNVEHHVGLPDHVQNRDFKTKYILNPPQEPEGPETPEKELAENEEGEGEEGKEGTEPESTEAKRSGKKGWFSWLGKGGSSSADARV